MGTIKVEKGIQIPPTPNRCKGFTAALRELKEIGDSVLLPTSINIVGNLARQAKLDFKITARTVEGGVRAWRIK